LKQINLDARENNANLKYSMMNTCELICKNMSFPLILLLILEQKMLFTDQEGISQREMNQYLHYSMMLITVSGIKIDFIRVKTRVVK
jgi:hypothetical protein